MTSQGHCQQALLVVRFHGSPTPEGLIIERAENVAFESLKQWTAWGSRKVSGVWAEWEQLADNTCGVQHEDAIAEGERGSER